MTGVERRPSPENGEESGVPSDDISPGTPRWVKVFGIVTLVVILLFLLLLATRGLGGGHGPGLHL